MASMDPAMGGPPQGIRNSIAELDRLGIRNEAVCCDAPDAAWLGKDPFPVHTLGPGKYGFAYTPKLGPWLEENLPRFDAVIVHGLWLWPSTCAVRAVARERARRREQKAGHRLTRMGEDKSERLAADRTGGEYLAPGIAYGPSTAGGPPVPALGGLSSEKSDLPESLNVQRSTLNSKQLRCFVMPHGMLDPWFQRDKSRRIKAVRNWFYWWLVERGVVNSADAMLFTCQQELELARTTFGGYRPKREINVGYGIAEPPAFEPKMQEAFAARCPGLNGRPYLLFMSRVHPKKNVAALVRAYARIAREHGEKGFSHSRAERDRQLEELSEAVKLTRIDEDGSERLAADRTGGDADCRMIAYGPSTASPPVSTAGSSSGANPAERVSLPDLVVAGPGWDSTYGQEVRTLIDEANRSISSTEHRTLSRGLGNRRWPQGKQPLGNTEHSAPIHAVDMLAGDAKWGALYGCEAFVLPSHQENFGIAVVEALACGKPVLISDQVNIWREIVEDGAGLAEEDTEGGVEKLLRRFLAKGMRHEAKGGRHEAEGIRQEAEGGPDGVASPPQAERAEGGGRMEDGRWRMADGGGAPRECYLKRFAIGPAAAKLARALKS